MKNQKYISKIKKFLYLLGLFGILFLIFNFNTVKAAASPTPTTSEALNEKLDSQIDQLKSKIASQVTQLNLVEKRGIIGIVSDASENQIMLTDVQGNSRGIDVDEITKFSSPSNSTFGFSDLTKGTRISVLGLYNKQSMRILARFIDVSVDPMFLTGEISDIDNTNIRFHIISDDQKKTNIDVESPTQISSYSKGASLATTGFSKLNIGDRVEVVGYPDKKDPTLVVADRIIVFADLPKDPKINIATPTPIQTPTPTTSNGSTVTPAQ